MKLHSVTIKNFRGYKGEAPILIANLTAFIGRNDVGKSTIFDALGAFFEHPLIKIESSDVCVFAENPREIRICCIFTDLPNEVTIDATSSTTLASEYLLNQQGLLEIHKVWPIKDGVPAKTSKTFIVASHPTANGFDGLLLKKQKELRERVKTLGVEGNANQNSNPSLRKAIWAAAPDLSIALSEIQVDKEDAKAIWEQLQKHLPDFALFRADRPSTDQDAEVQDPLKFAINQALAEIDGDLEAIKTKVRDRALTVAQRTLEKLKDFDEDLASKLEPNFAKTLKWDGVFKLSLDGEDGIPINKRGSGVRRLVLFSFFRAEAERLRQEKDKGNIIYAIEEPETAQHPTNQRKVVDALVSIAETDGCQVLLTTHVPALAGLLPLDAIRHVTVEADETRRVLCGSEQMFAGIAQDLGVLPDKRAKVIVCVEGPHDIRFLRRISKLLRTADQTLPDLDGDPRIAMILLGGSTLQEWVNGHFLRNVGLPEIHIYDRDVLQSNGQYKYQLAANDVNGRGDGSKAFLTQKREMENYLHDDAIAEAFQGHVVSPVTITVTDECDVEGDIRTAIGQGKLNRRSLKHWLNEDAADRMTVARLESRNGKDEVVSWLREILSKVQNA
jgi:putative ATP-dependent endonuclease of the OLD family